MKKLVLSIFFINLLYFAYTNDVVYERIYIFKIVAFNSRYEIFCTPTPNGYYKYPKKIHDTTVYLTYETEIFYNQCLFDENIIVFNDFYPSNMWSNSRGEVLRMKKRYGPVIDKNKERKNYPYSFGKN